MIKDEIEPGDMDALAAILEAEKKSHCRVRGLCFGLFVFCFAILVAAIAVAAAYITGFVFDRPDNDDVGRTLGMLQLLMPLSAAVVAFFSMWWTAQNCINSIERTLFAARAGRARLFASFLREIQCANKKTKKIWLELAASAIT